MARDDVDRLLATMRDRRSVRRFRSDPVPDDAVATLVEAARWAPSAGNRQAWRLLVVTDPALRAALDEAVREAVAAIRADLRDAARADADRYLDHFTHFAGAPLLLAPIHRGVDLLGASRGGKGDEASARRAEADAIQSVAAAIQNLLLAAHALGLGACWMTGPLVAEAALARLLRVPAGWVLSALVPVGWPAEQPAPPPRRRAETTVRRVAAQGPSGVGPSEAGLSEVGEDSCATCSSTASTK